VKRKAKINDAMDSDLDFFITIPMVQVVMKEPYWVWLSSYNYLTTYGLKS